MSFAATMALQELSRLCVSGASGTLFVTMTDNHQLRIGLLRGHIVHMASLSMRGKTALKTLALRTPKGFRFEAGLAPEPQSDLPPTPAILAFLSEDQAHGADLHAASQNHPEGAAQIDPGILAAISEELSEYFGPIAEILVDEQRQAASLPVLLNRLMAQFEDPAQAQTFAERVRKRIG